MSLFRKQPQPVEDEPAVAPPRPAPVPAVAQTAPTPAATPAATGAAPTLFNGPRVDIDAIYKAAKLSADELDRVSRAEQLLHLLPTTASHTREVVDATFRAFGVDRTKILEASSKQLRSLEGFIRYSHEQTQHTLDANAKKIAELEAEIARCRQVSAKATSEGEERARSVNDVLVKVQRVLDFFGDQARSASSSEMDLENTAVMKPDKAKLAEAAQPAAPPIPARPRTPSGTP